MVKLLPILVTVLLAYLGQNAHEKIQMPKHSTDTSVIDGPYVFYRNDSVLIKYVEDNSRIITIRTDSMPSTTKSNVKLYVNTDMPGKSFTVNLKSNLTNEKSEFNGVHKMLVLSDIEGNFAALRKLLQANHVIDENFNWIFNKDHLVLIGDLVDRGTMVTEVLWLIYSLEEKAKAAGGHVHFILGNHEIMNMSGDLRYVQERYIKHAALMNKQYMQLFGADAEIGRWLATKNVVERVGNILFTHGGISSYVNNLQIPLNQLNALVRPFYSDTSYKYPDKRLNVLYSDYGPFWYRGYYMEPKATLMQIDSTLNFYGVQEIATGHTIVANEIRSFYNSKIFDTDVHHASGHSEALLIEGGKFWRVNGEGEKFKIDPL